MDRPRPRPDRRLVIRIRTLGLVAYLLATHTNSSAAATSIVEHRVDWAPTSPHVESSLLPHLTFWPDAGAGPARVVRVEIPAGTRVVDVTLDAIDEHPVARAAPPSSPDRIVPLGPRRLGAGGYGYWILGASSFRGHRIADIAVSTTRDDTDGGLHALDRFTLRLSCVPGERAALARRVVHPRTEAADRRALARLLDAAPLPLAESRSDGNDPALDPIEYVIVTDDAQLAAYQELADIKTREGMPAVVTSVSSILAGYEGIDPAARVRAYLRDLYLYRGLRFALLGGDSDQVPVRLAANEFQSLGRPILLAADSYFACLDGDWNADGDDVMGEAPNILAGEPGDDVDLVADIFVSRVPSSSSAEAEAFVAKWKSYTGYDPTNFRTDYQNRYLALAEVIFPASWSTEDDPGAIVRDGADFCESTMVFLPETIERTRLYEYWQDPDHQPAQPELKETVIQEINAGYGIVDHVGHGFRTTMSVGDGKLVNADADAFTNTNAYSLLYGINCTSGAVLFDCIAEHLINNPTGGAVASVASSDLDYPNASDVFKYEFFRLIFQSDVTRLGEAYHFADLPQVPLANIGENVQRWTIMSLIAFGDPAMEIWRGTPQSFSLDVPATFELGAGGFTISVTDGTAAVEGATVCFRKDDAYAVGTTDASGSVVLPVRPSTPGPATVTVTKNTFVPAIDSTLVVIGAAAALSVPALTFHDGTPSGGTGNGDGGVDAGETILVDVHLSNVGAAAVAPGTLVLSLDSPFVAATTDTAALPALGAGESATVNAAFAFDVDRVLPAELSQTRARATIVATSGASSWDDVVDFPIRQRILDLVGARRQIPDDDGDGGLDPGETAEIYLTIRNHGEAPAVDVVALVGNDDTDHLLLDDTVSFGDIAPGESVESPPLRVLSTGGGDGYALSFFASDRNRLAVLARTIDALAPATPDTVTTDARAGSIIVRWPQVPAEDLRGYRVYRSLDPGGPFSRIGTIVEAGSYYEDADVEALVLYHYRVTSVDWSGNESAPSQSASATTSPPFAEGWPVPLPSGLSKGSPTLADLDGDGPLEILFGWADPMVLTSDGGDFVDGDDSALTVGIFSVAAGSGRQFWNSPAVADIDEDGVLEAVFAAWQSTGDAHLYVLDATGAVEPGWPRVIGRQPWSTPAIGEVDGLPGLEIFVSSGEGSSSSPLRGALLGFHHDGTEILDGDSDPGTIGVFYKQPDPDTRFMYGSPALADLDGDLRDEIVFVEKTSHAAPTASTLYAFDGDGTVLPGFPYGAGELLASTSSPAVADLNGDGSLEIIVVTEDRISVVTAAGEDAPGWPRALPLVTAGQSAIRDFLSSPAVGDVNLDETTDIALGWLDGTIHAWDGVTGDPLPGFPSALVTAGSAYSAYLHSPVIGNVDEDPNPEILAGSGDGRLVAANHDGTLVDGYPIRTADVVNGSPILWDLDGDGNMNIVVQSEAPVIEVFDLPNVPFVPAENPWPMFRHDARKSGASGAAILPEPRVASERSEPGMARVGAPRPNPLRGGRVRLPFDVPEGGDAVEIRVFDVAGREVRTLARGRFPAGAFEIAWDGRGARGERAGAGVYLVRIVVGDRRFARKIVIAD